MATFRTHKNGDYIVMGNIHLKDRMLSLKAKGLLSLMLSLPDNWDYSILGLATLSKDGKDSVMSALDELCNSGYIDMSTMRNERGQYETVYDIYETPIRETRCGKSESENPPQYNINNISPIINNSPNKDKILKKKKEIKEREQEFKETLYPFCKSRGGQYEDSMVENFFNYWSEYTHDGKKMLWETKASWQTAKRLATWNKRNNSNVRTCSTSGQYVGEAEQARASYRNLADQLNNCIPQLDLE
jgi:hypothetical protein